MDNEDLSRSIIIACLIGGILVLGINLSLRYKIAKDEQFSELYLLQEEAIPDKIIVNNSYNVTYYLQNHKQEETTYIIEVDSFLVNTTHAIKLLPGERTRIDLSLEPTGKDWEINLSLSKDTLSELNVMGEGFLSEKNELLFVIDNKTYGGYQPFTFNLPHFGSIYHANISLKELEEKPLTIEIRQNQTSTEKSINLHQKVSIFGLNDSLYASSNLTETVYVTRKKPLSVKLYEIDTSTQDFLEVHIWYEIKDEK